MMAASLQAKGPADPALEALPQVRFSIAATHSPVSYVYPDKADLDFGLDS